MTKEENYRQFVRALAANPEGFKPSHAAHMMLKASLRGVMNTADGSLDRAKKQIFYGEEKPYEVGGWDAPDWSPREWNIFHALIGLITEAGELAEIAMDMAFGEGLNETDLLEELGDNRFYFELACDNLGTSEEEVRRANMAKLMERYKGAEFDAEQAREENRDKDAERSKMMEER